LEAKQIAKILGRLGLVLLALFVALVVVDALPLKLLDPDWILNTTANLVNLVTIPLVGVAFIHLAGYISESTHRKLQSRVAQLAALLALLFFLILPMLGFAVVRNAKNLNAANQQTIQAISKKGRELEQAVKSAASFNDLKSKMQSMGGPQIGDSPQAIPLPELKKQLLDILARAKAAIPARLVQPNSPALLVVYKRVFRTGLLGLLGAFGFGLLAWDPMVNRNILANYASSFNVFGAGPGSLFGTLAQMLNDFQAQRQRSDELGRIRSVALQRERELQKAKALQERDKKRNTAERRKHEQHMERDRQRRAQAKQSQNKDKDR
jgi:hypothetical protein